MKKFTFLFSLLLTQFAFAQWDGDFPGDGTFPWHGDSSIVVTDSMIVINGDTIFIDVNPGDGENPWDNDWDGNDNPWGDSTDVDFPWDDIEVINDSTIVINGDTIIHSFPGDGENPWDNDWDGNDNPWDDSTDVDFPWDDIEVINDSTIVIGGDTIIHSFPGDGENPWDNDWDGNDNPWDDSTDVDNPWDGY